MQRKGALEKPGEETGPRMRRFGGGMVLGIALLALVLLSIVYFVFDSLLGYVMVGVGSDEVGVQFVASQPVNVVGPGVYTDIRLFADIKKIAVRDIPFTVTDPEVLTKDKQRIGVKVTGTVRRPGLHKANVLIESWASYSTFYTQDDVLVDLRHLQRRPA